MFRSMCFCLALVCTMTAFGQQRQQVSVQVNGGRIVGEFVPDGQQVAPPVVVQQHQHVSNCSCVKCKRAVAGKTKQVFSETRTTVVTTEHFVDEHPVQFFNESPPVRPTPQRNLCPPQNPCVQPRQSGGGLIPWNQGFVGYQPQRQCCPPWRQPIHNGFSGRQGGRSVAVNGGFSLFGFGPQINMSAGHQPPPYAQSGHNYGGAQSWYGGRQW